MSRGEKRNDLIGIIRLQNLEQIAILSASELQRRDFIAAADARASTARLFVASASVAGDGSVSVNFAATAIYDFDVRRWARALAD